MLLRPLVHRSRPRSASAPAVAIVLALLASCSTARVERASVSGPQPAPTPDAVSAAPSSRVGETLAVEQQGGGGAQADGDQALKQANNPLANMKALNFQNYRVADLSGTDQSANTAWLRYAQPISTGFGDWLMRASLPLSTVPTGMDESTSGLGDANVFAAYLFETDDPGVSYGVGPLLGLPTGSEDETTNDVWSAGLAAVLYNARSATLQYGGLVTYQHGFAGSGDTSDVNLLAMQPFVLLQMGGGFYWRSTGIWAFDLETGNYSVPFGAGIGKVVKAGKTVFNIFIEPQFSVLSEGPGQPEFQVFFGFNAQFLGG